ncbi:MAG: type transport system permease protein [Clostridiales bacterium]|jgi:hypothetical protein|nr:ABC-2 transporter permease [Pygmaiobacter sp.]MDK2813044.1 type transport system permease protein [Clostridiales bacterium]
MSGILYKDLMNLRRYLRQLVLVFAVLLVIFSFSDNNYSFISAYAIMISMMTVISSLAYDEQAHWDKYALTMPLSRKTLVGSKYLLGLLIALAGSVIALLVIVGGVLLANQDLIEGLSVVASCLCVALILLAILLPFIYKFGVEKARMMMLAVFLLPTLAILAASQLGLQMPGESFWLGVAIALPIVTIAGYFISFLVSVRIFSKKEL